MIGEPHGLADDEWPIEEPPDDYVLPGERSDPTPIRPSSEVPAAQTLADLDRRPPEPLIGDRIEPTGHTIVYGTGDVGKGTLVTSWIGSKLVADGRRVMILDYENHPEEWARRYHGLFGADGADRVVHVAPGAASWTGVRGSIWQQVADIARRVVAYEVDHLVIDSTVMACGGADPTDPGTAALYSLALEFIGLPALSLAHVTKADDLRYPFGSIFWHNLARVTWSLAKDGDARILTNRKANNYAPIGRFVVTTTWRDDLPRDVMERGYTAVLSDRIDEVLEGEGLTVGAIVARLNDEAEDGQRVKADSVRAALRRGARVDPKRYTVTGSGDAAVWSRP